MIEVQGFPVGSDGKDLPAMQETWVWSLGQEDPWVRKFPGERDGGPLQYSCLSNPMDRGAWWATVHGVIESDMTELLTLKCRKDEIAI